MSKPYISIVILTKNPGPKFKDILDSLARQTLRNFELLVIDSGSTDGTLQLLTGYKLKLHPIKPGEFGHGKTRNLAISMATGEIIVFITQDAQPSSNDWLRHMTKPFENPKVAGVFGRQIPPKNATLLEKYYSSYLYPSYSRVEEMKPEEKFKITRFFFSNANSGIRKSVWVKYKFREDVVMSEDQWWAKQVLMEGYKISYIAKAAVYHSHNYNLGNLFRRNFDSGASLREIGDVGTWENYSGLLRYLLGEIIFLKKIGKPGLIFYALIYESVRIIAFLIGQNYFLFPKIFRRSMSSHSYFWR